MKIKIIIFLLILGIASFSSASELKIPFSCWPKELKEEFAKADRKLDIHSEDRTNDSWGYIINKGSSFVIYTYGAVTDEDFEIIQKIIFKIELEKREPNE